MFSGVQAGDGKKFVAIAEITAKHPILQPFKTMQIKFSRTLPSG